MAYPYPDFSPLGAPYAPYAPQRGDETQGNVRGNEDRLDGPLGLHAPHTGLDHPDLVYETERAGYRDDAFLGSPAHDPHYPHYRQWRQEQLRSLDDDYRAWRDERYARFTDEFSQWRNSRQRSNG